MTAQLPLFGGKTYDPARDEARLKKQLGRVYEVLSDGRWHTLKEIRFRAAVLRGDGKWDSEAGISARIRDLRKVQHGSHQVERRRVSGGLWEYRLRRANAEA